MGLSRKDAFGVESHGQEDELTSASLLVLCNKQDMPHAMPVTQVADKLGLPHLKSRQWHIQATCATTGASICFPSCSFSGDGLFEGLDWLGQTLK